MRRQVIDLPAPQVEIMEHQALHKVCPRCQTVSAGAFPVEVSQPVQYGARVARALHWIHVASSAILTYYARHAKRGLEAIQALGILVGFVGRRVHDAMAAYLKLPGLHALCNAHLLRELIGLVEDDPTQVWAARLIGLLVHMKDAVAEAGRAGEPELPGRQRAGFEAAYTRLIHLGEQANPPPVPTGRRGRPKKTPARNLLDRLSTHRGAVLAFLHDFRVPFDNNRAERDLRMFKVQLKVSGCFRSPEGADYFCRIRGYLSTLRKQDYSVLAGLVSVFNGQPYMPRLDG